MLIEGMYGLGDNIYQRAFIKNIRGEVYLRTAWPELYKDLDHVKFIKANTNLRTQAKNIERQKNSIYSKKPKAGRSIQVVYGNRGIFRGMRNCLGVEPGIMDLPDFGAPPVVGKYVLVRPVTLRSEWMAETRNPLPGYIESATNIIRDYGYKIVSVADLKPKKEWIIGNTPKADITYHKGELDVSGLLALTQNACAVIGGIGWILPAAMASNIPGFIVCGGQGGHNSPQLLTDNSQDLSKIGFAVPDRFCKCRLGKHNCDKRISNFNGKTGRLLHR